MSLKNPNADIERGAYTTIVYRDGDLCIAEDNEGSIIKENSDAATAIQAAIGEGLIVLDGDFSITSEIEIANSDVHIWCLEGTTLTADAIINSIFKIDPKTQTETFENIYFTGGIYKGNEKAKTAIKVIGDRTNNYYSSYMKIHDVKVKNTTEAAFRFDAAESFSLLNCRTYSCNVGFQIDNASLNSLIFDFHSWHDDYGFKILKDTHICENPSISHSDFMFLKRCIVEHVYDLQMDTVCIDHASENALEINAVNMASLDNLYVGVSAATSSVLGRGIVIKGETYGVNISRSHIQEAYTHAIEIIPVATKAPSRVIIDKCTFWDNARSGNGYDVLNDSGLFIRCYRCDMIDTGVACYHETNTLNSPNYIRLVRNQIVGGLGTILAPIIEITANHGYKTKNDGNSTGTSSQQTIAHGLATTPTKVILWDIETVANAYQSAPATTTNIYITAATGKDYGWEAEV